MCSAWPSLANILLVSAFGRHRVVINIHGHMSAQEEDEVAAGGAAEDGADRASQTCPQPQPQPVSLGSQPEPRLPAWTHPSPAPTADLLPSE